MIHENRNQSYATTKTRKANWCPIFWKGGCRKKVENLKMLFVQTRFFSIVQWSTTSTDQNPRPREASKEKSPHAQKINNKSPRSWPCKSFGRPLREPVCRMWTTPVTKPWTKDCRGCRMWRAPCTCESMTKPWTKDCQLPWLQEVKSTREPWPYHLLLWAAHTKERDRGPLHLS